MRPNLSGKRDGPLGPHEDILYHVGVDYLTCTAVESKGWEPLHQYATGLFRWQADIGNNPRPWGMAGFKGWMCGSVAVGKREQETIVRLSSDAADRSWRKAVELAGNISRLDLQATVRPTAGPTRTIDRHRAQAAKNAKAFRDKRVVRWVRDNRDGYTLYLGQRSSICFGRIYDKFQESQLEHYKGCVRYEVQYHNKLAKHLACSLTSNNQPIPRIASALSQFFRGRGVDLELHYNPLARYSCPRLRSDADRNLKWLTEAVRPTVSRLIALGRGEECLRALGLIEDD